MPAHSDHIRRDAEHAARNAVSTCLGKFQRRMLEYSKVSIAKAIEGIEGEVDFDFGTEIGRKAAEEAIRQFLFDNPQQVTSRPLEPSTSA